MKPSVSGGAFTEGFGVPSISAIEIAIFDVRSVGDGLLAVRRIFIFRVSMKTYSGSGERLSSAGPKE